MEDFVCFMERERKRKKKKREGAFLLFHMVGESHMKQLPRTGTEERGPECLS
jgi:hypothetical protein